MSGQRSQAPDDIQQLQHQIDETREELADTVEALAAKTDVKARAKEKAVHIRAQAVRRLEPLTAKLMQHRVQVGAGAGAVAAGLLALFAWRKRA
jgi:ElaB/YqjD/DUF883 family membrane-anchored ribosome-binding protein